MIGVSRAALASTREALQSALDSGADWGRLAGDLFAVVDLLDSSSALRRAFADPSRGAEVKRNLAIRLLGDRIDRAALSVVRTAVSQRWSSERDLVDALEDAAVECEIAMADAAGRADDVEEQLFRFERTVAASPDLRDALTDRRLPTERKLELVTRLLDGKVHDEALRLVRRLVAHPRGRRFAQGIEHVLDVAARRREQLSGVVTVAAPLSHEQHERLTAALRQIYGRPVQLKMVVDPDIVGGIRVQVGDEVVDGTVVRRLEQARRGMGA